MREYIKGGKNVSVGDITVINEGISLADSAKKNEETPIVTTPEPAEEKPIENPSSEITPDVVVGEADAASNVIPIPIPENPVIPNAIDTPITPSVETPDVSDGVIFPQTPSGATVDVTPNIASDFGTQEQTQPQNFQTPSFNSLANENNFGYNDNNTFSSFNSGDTNLFGQNTSILGSYNDSYSNKELPVEIQNAMRLLEATANRFNKIETERDSLLGEVSKLKEENKNLKNSNVSLRNEISSMQSSLAQAQSKMLDIFGLGGMSNIANARSNSYSDFGNNQNNNGMNMAA